MNAPGPACERCGCVLRTANAAALCDPCSATVASCAPFVAVAREQAPLGVNLLELVAGLMLTHDALHPGQPLYLREALAAHGVDTDNVRIQQAAAKLRRRHRLILSGDSRRPGYRGDDWLWTARRTRSSVEELRMEA